MHNLELGYKGLSIFSRSHFLSSYIIYAPPPPFVFHVFYYRPIIFLFSAPAYLRPDIPEIDHERRGKRRGEGESMTAVFIRRVEMFSIRSDK